VHRAHRDFVDLFSLDPVEIGDADLRRRARRALPGVVTGALRADEAHRLEPGMALGNHSPLLRDFALEEVHLRAARRHRRERLADARARRLDRAILVHREDRQQFDALAGRPAVKRCHAPPAPRSAITQSRNSTMSSSGTLSRAIGTPL